jgi:hypothetical protein
MSTKDSGCLFQASDRQGSKLYKPHMPLFQVRKQTQDLCSKRSLNILGVDDLKFRARPRYVLSMVVAGT